MFRTYHRGMVSRSCWSTVQTHPTNDYKTEYTIQRCIEVCLEKGINAVQTLSRCVKECTYLNGAAPNRRHEVSAYRPHLLYRDV